MTNEARQDTNARRTAINAGVSAFPIRLNECVMPCANPQLPAGVQLAIARVAVGNAAPSPKPKARRIANREANPPTAPVRIVDTPTMAQHTLRVSRGPN